MPKVNQEGTIWLYSVTEGTLLHEPGYITEIRLTAAGGVHAVHVRSRSSGIYFCMRAVGGELRTRAVLKPNGAKYSILFDTEDNFYVVHQDKIVRSNFDWSTPELEWE